MMNGPTFCIVSNMVMFLIQMAIKILVCWFKKVMNFARKVVQIVNY